MAQTKVNINTENNTSITADCLIDNWYQIEEGETTTVSLRFEESPNAVTESTSSTVGDTSVGFTVGGTSGLESQYSSFMQLYEHLVYAGNAYTGEGINFTPQFREQLAQDASISSLLVQIEPVEDLQSKGIKPIWGIIMGGQDRRNLPLSNWILDLELFVLDSNEEYDAHSEIRSELEV